ncbi:MAG: histidine kinase [Clostridiales bacterium]|jgi:hypothetical protein|nr:histidine kinase [Clostridiales bacterium]MDR2749892.1 histidine kinase [Clostridiales bacterium]
MGPKIKRTLALLACVIVPLMIAANVSTYMAIQKNATDARQNLLQLIANQISKDLSSETSAIDELTIACLDKVNDLSSQNELQRYLATISLLNLIAQKIANAPIAECYFVTMPDQGVCLTRFSANAKHKFEMEQFLKGAPGFKNASVTGEWEIINVNGYWCLFKVFKLLQIEIGAVVRLERILENPDVSLFCETDSGVSIGDLPQGRYALEKTQIGKTSLLLAGAWNESGFSLPPSIAIITCLGFLALSIIAIGAISIRHSIKAKEYEELLERQKDETRWLAAQIKPHFYLNAISTISSLAYLDRNSDIQAYIKALSEYLRYLLADWRSMSTVADEIKHAADFIKLQQIRYPGNISCAVDIDPEAAGVAMPRLVLQTFTENVFKHAFRYGRPLTVQITAKMASGYVRIFVDDDGDGFGEYLKSPEKPEQKGISNIRRTLELMYGQKGLLKLSDLPGGGARAELRIPCLDLCEVQNAKSSRNRR